MSQQTDRQTEENQASNKSHIASLTISQMIMLNLTVLQKLKKFQFDLVITEQDDNKIYAYEYQQENSYLLLVPRSFYFSTKNRCKSFIELLSLCSRTITVPLRGNYYDEFSSLLSSFCLSHRYKKGKSVIKFYLNGQCSISYLDFVTFQAIQFKQKGPKELLSMKKSNGFQFSLTYFKEQVLPSIFQSEQESIQIILESQTNLIKQLYKDLICEQRFSLIYDVMKQTGISFKELQREIQAMVLSRHITTVADQEYELIINKQLETIIEQQLDRFKYDLLNISQKENQGVYLRVVYQILNRLRQNQFEVNDDKYMLITSKILQSSSIKSKDREESFAEENRQLKMALDIQSQEIHRLQRQLQKYRERSTEKKKKNLEIVIEQMDQSQPILRVKSNNSLTKERLSIKDLKEPLQMMTFNTPNNKSSGKLNSTLVKSTQKKPKEGFRKKGVKQKA